MAGEVKARRLAVVSSSGGSGRSTLVLNLALTMAKRGKRTLALELSPQGGLGSLLARPDSAGDPGLIDVMKRTVSFEDALRRSKNLPELSIMFRGRLEPAEEGAFVRMLSTGGTLDRLLDSSTRNQEIVIIDPPTGQGDLTRAALRAAELVLITVPADPLGVRAWQRAARLVAHVKQEENRSLDLLGVVATKVDGDSAASLKALEELRANCPQLLEAEFVQDEFILTSSETGRPIALHPGETPSLMKPVEFLADLLQGLGGQERVSSQGSEGETKGSPASGSIFGPSGWNHFLEACLRETRAESAFLLDGRGLAIAESGRLDAKEIEGLGSRVMIALEQAGEIVPTAGNKEVSSLSMEFDSSWLTSLTTTSGGQRLTLGILGQETIPLRLRRTFDERLLKLLERPLPELDLSSG